MPDQEHRKARLPNTCQQRVRKINLNHQPWIAYSVTTNILRWKASVRPTVKLPNHFPPCCPQNRKSATPAIAVKQEDKGQPRGAATTADIDSYAARVQNGPHNPNAVFTEMMVSGKVIQFLVDSGTAGNTVLLFVLPPGSTLQPIKTTLTTYNGSTLSTEGTAVITLANLVTSQHHQLSLKWWVVTICLYLVLQLCKNLPC